MARPTDGNEHSEHFDHVDHVDHPDLTGVAGEMRAEWRAEQEAVASDAVAYWRHGRSLNDWLRDRMHAGDRVAATFVAQTFAGLVEEVGDDLVALRCVDGRVEIHVGVGVPVSFALVEHATEGGARSDMQRGFRDALLAREQQTSVRVGTVLEPDGIDGVLLVGRDFVSVLTDAGVETATPIAHVAWVAPTR